MSPDKTRNFCIIAHIDHGKSTLADRMMELTDTVKKREMKAQLLDSMELEREKGITIKLTPVTMHWRGHTLNLIDTPGHVDFSYEVSRSLQAVETAVLVVDATQGIQAQTLANVYLAIEQDLKIIPVINKIDLPAADVEKVTLEIIDLLACAPEDIIGVSAKTGLNVEQVLDTIIKQGPAPKVKNTTTETSGTAGNAQFVTSKTMPREAYEPSASERLGEAAACSEKVLFLGHPEATAVAGGIVGNAQFVSSKTVSREAYEPSEAREPRNDGSEQARSKKTQTSTKQTGPAITNKLEPTRALIFDSYFDDYRGVVLYVRIVDGAIPKNSEIKMLATNTTGLALEVGILTPKMSPQPSLQAGQIGYIVTNLKTTKEAKVGDTITLASAPATTPLPGYKNVLPFVYAGFFPVSNDQYKILKDAIDKLSLSDAALNYEPENSPVLGFGLRIGFLGLLHLDIIKERLEREFKLDLIITNPSTNYHVTMNDGTAIEIKSAADLPDISHIKEIKEPWAKGEIILPSSMIGGVLNLINEKRGHQTNLSYIEDRAIIDFKAPMANLLTDFYDQLKSITSGYASFNYEIDSYYAEDLVRVDFLVAGSRIDALSLMCHRSEAEAIGRDITKKLKAVIPRQNFEVALQSAIGARILARETIGAYRKDVTVKIHTGDRDRKAKLLSKQKKGKARMKRFGKIDIPSEAFTIMLKRD